MQHLSKQEIMARITPAIVERAIKRAAAHSGHASDMAADMVMADYKRLRKLIDSKATTAFCLRYAHNAGFIDY